MKKIRIPVYRPDLSGNEKTYVNECLDSTWISSRGRFISDFETRFADFIDVSNAAAVCNGTVALHLALVALGIGPGDEVIVPTLTYIASGNAVSYTGATPVFVDSLRDSWQIDPEDVARHITSRTRAIMPVHLYGQAAPMDELLEIARKNRLFVVEDCAEAIGTKYKGRHVGTFGDISTFSFFGNKTITTGEGGMVVTNDTTLAERVRHFKGQGLAAHREYWHDVIGYNYRMTNVAAAIGLAQLERVDSLIRQKRIIAETYHALARDLPIEMHREQPDTIHSFWMVSLLVARPELREKLRNHLAAIGVETRPVFYPLHTMPIYARTYRKHPVAEDLAWRGINLPSWPGLEHSEIEEIVSGIRDFYRSNP